MSYRESTVPLLLAIALPARSQRDRLLMLTGASATYLGVITADGDADPGQIGEFSTLRHEFHTAPAAWRF